MNHLLTDVRFALRGLRREPRFALFVVATLAAAIGANATLLGLADRLLFRGPEAIEQSTQVMRVQLTAQPPDRPAVSTFTMGHVLFSAIRDHAATGLKAASYARNPATLGRGAGARPLRLGYASPEFFSLLGTTPLRGRFLDARDNVAAAGGSFGDGDWHDYTFASGRICPPSTTMVVPVTKEASSEARERQA